MGNLELLERAFALAESGEITSVQEIREALRKDGTGQIDLIQFQGRALMAQLSGKIDVARHRREESSH